MSKKQIIATKNFKKNNVERYLLQDIIYFYMAALSRKHGKTYLAALWVNEIRHLYCSILTEIIRATKNSLDYQKEFSEVITKVKNVDISCRLCAERIMKTNYGLINIKYHITDKDTIKFWKAIDRDFGIENDESIEKVAKQLASAMTWNRHEYIDKIQCPLNRAIEYFYQVKLAKKHGRTTMVHHWMNEVHRLLGHDFKNQIKYIISGFTDRRKAIYEAISEIQQDDKNFRHGAEYAFKKYYKLSKIKVPIDDEDTANFWTMVEQVIESALNP